MDDYKDVLELYKLLLGMDVKFTSRYFGNKEGKEGVFYFSGKLLYLPFWVERYSKKGCVCYYAVKYDSHGNSEDKTLYSIDSLNKFLVGKLV